MKYNSIMPRDDDSFYLWIDSLKGFRLKIKGEGNHNFNQEAEVLFQIERERIIKLLEETYRITLARNEADLLAFLIALIKGENK